MSDKGKKPLARLLDAIAARANAVTYVLLCVGIAWFAVLPILQRRVGFDENALLAGSAHPTIRSDSHWAISNAELLGSSYESVHETSKTVSWIRQQMELLGMDAHSHTYASITDPLTKRTVSCTNVHGILRADRGDAKESILLVTPLQFSSTHTDFQQSSKAASFALSLGHAILAHLSKVPWLAKDVIWVVPDASCGLVTSMDAWVYTYQSVASSAHNESFGRAGVLQQAIILEVPTAAFNAIELSVEGYDGQLPKLDMYWMLKYYSSSWTGLPVLLRGQVQAIQLAEAFKDTPALQQHVASLANLAQFVWRQARGLPLGAHAAFKVYNVDAVTVRLVHEAALPELHASRAQLLAQLADVLELSLRSCNVLIEKFHHSLFLYLQSSPEHYVSIDMYIIGPVALLACLLLQAAASMQVHAQLLGPGQQPRWAGSIRRVLLAHAVCAALGLALRQGLQRAGVAHAAGTAWLANEAQRDGAAGLSMQPLAMGTCAAVLVLAAVSSTLSTWHDSGSGSDAGQQQVQAAAAEQLQSRVALMSVSSTLLSALVMINWALAYACLLLVAPLAVLAAKVPQVGTAAGEGKEGEPAAAGLRRRLVAAVLSPAAVPVYLLLLAGHGLPSLQGAAALVAASRGLTYMVFWAVYVPFWWLCAAS